MAWDDRRRELSRGANCRARANGPQPTSLPVVTGVGSHPFPFRTRKLSLLPPMVLHGKLCGRVGRCRHYLERPDEGKLIGPFPFSTPPSMRRRKLSQVAVRKRENLRPGVGSGRGRPRRCSTHVL